MDNGQQTYNRRREILTVSTFCRWADFARHDKQSDNFAPGSSVTVGNVFISTVWIALLRNAIYSQAVDNERKVRLGFAGSKCGE